MERVHQWTNQILHGGYKSAIILLLGIIIMLTGEFSTMLSSAKILRSFADGGTVVQLINILPLAILGLMFPLGPIWLQNGNIVKTFQKSLLIFMAGTLLVSINATLPILIIGRVVQTVGCGIMLPMMSALVAILLPESSRFANFDQTEDMILGFSAILAMITTGIAFLIGNWKYVNIFLIIMILLIYYSTSFVKINLEVTHYEIEWLNVVFSSGFLLLIGWLVTLTKVGVKVPSWSSWFFFLSGLLFIGIYMWQELHVEHPLVDFRGLFNIRYLRGVFLQGIGAASLIVLMILGVLYLKQGLKYPIFMIGISLIPAIIVMIVVHHCTKKFFGRFDAVNNTRTAMGIMMFGWGCLSLFSAHLHLIMFVIFTMIIEAGHGLLIQVGKNLSSEQKSKRLENMADLFTSQFKLLASAMVLTVLSVVLQNVTENQTSSALPGKLSSLLGYRAAFIIFFVITIIGWIITMIAGRNFNLSKYFLKRK